MEQGAEVRGLQQETKEAGLVDLQEPHSRRRNANQQGEQTVRITEGHSVGCDPNLARTARVGVLGTAVTRASRHELCQRTKRRAQQQDNTMPASETGAENNPSTWA